MWLKLAWKNIRRNSRRTLLSAVAIGLVSAMLCLLFAFQQGMLDDMQLNIRNHVTGDVRVRNALYSEYERVHPIQFSIPNAQDVAQAIAGVAGVQEVQVVLKHPISIYRNDTVTGATALGVDIASSPFVHGQGSTLVEGELPQPGTRDVLVTDTLSQRLGIGIGDRFTFLARTANGGTNGVTVKAVGIIHIEDTDFGGNSMLIDWSTLSSLLRMDGGALELLVMGSPGTTAEELAGRVRAALDGMGLPIEAESIAWMHANGLYQMFPLMELIYLLLSLFFFLLAATVIFNTTMMGVMERSGEVGTLIALGYTPWQVRNLFLLETTIISFLAATAGALLGAVGVVVLHHVGLDLNAMGGSSLSGMSFSAFIYPSLEFGSYVQVVLVGTIVSVLACLFPTAKVLHVDPAVALRSDT